MHVIPINLPPLRERGSDVIEIAHALLGMTSVEEGKDFTRFAPEVVEYFQNITGLEIFESCKM